jgi:hypothetical protein
MPAMQFNLPTMLWRPRSVEKRDRVAKLMIDAGKRLKIPCGITGNGFLPVFSGFLPVLSGPLSPVRAQDVPHDGQMGRCP